jgi:hypothetical protein
MPEFLQNNDYKPPQTQSTESSSTLKATKSYKGDLFHYYAEHPREGNSFNQLMGGIMAGQASLLDVIPADSFLNGSDPNLPLLVDIGGNIGHDIENFRQVYPDTAARLYLQDLPGVIANSKCPEPVNKMAHDFFTPQPIKGVYIPIISTNFRDTNRLPQELACATCIA